MRVAHSPTGAGCSPQQGSGRAQPTRHRGSLSGVGELTPGGRSVRWLRVAVACTDPTLSGSVSAVIAAVGGMAVDCVPGAGLDPHRLAVQWVSADAVVVEAGWAERLLSLGLPPRPGVLVVAGADETSNGWAHAGRLGAAAVVGLPAGEDLLVDQLGRIASGCAAPDSGAQVIAVVPGSGGAGASTLAVLLATAAAACGRRTALVDLDPLGGGLDLPVGAELAAGPRWPDLTADRDGLVGLAAALPAVGSRSAEWRLLSWDRRTSADRPDATLTVAAIAGLRSTLDVVVLDLPRCASEEALAGCGLADEALLVCARQVRAAAAATQLTAQLDGLPRRLRLVAGSTGSVEISGPDVAAAVDLPLLAMMPWDRRLPRLAAVGRLHRVSPRTRSMRSARALLRALEPQR